MDFLDRWYHCLHCIHTSRNPKLLTHRGDTDIIFKYIFMDQLFFIIICWRISPLRPATIGSLNDTSAPSRRQAIIWTDVYIFYWPIYASLTSMSCRLFHLNPLNDFYDNEDPRNIPSNFSYIKYCNVCLTCNVDISVFYIHEWLTHDRLWSYATSGNWE